MLIIRPKKKILIVTEQMVTTEGIEKVSVRNIAKEASVNIASINYYFSSKGHLLAEILERKLNHLKKELYQSLIHTKKIETIPPVEFASIIF